MPSNLAKYRVSWRTLKQERKRKQATIVALVSFYALAIALSSFALYHGYTQTILSLAR